MSPSMQESERTCWICFSTAAETPSHIRWVSPCACLGDTRWVHERCLLTWIVHKQSEAEHDGEPLTLLVDYHGTGASAATNEDNEGNTAEVVDVPPLTAGAAQVERQRRQLREVVWEALAPRSQSGNGGSSRPLVKCPQCGTPYHVQMGHNQTWFESFTIQTVESFTSASNAFAVQFTFVGLLYGTVISSVTYGLYAVGRICGPTDPLTLSLARDPWTWKYWLSLFSTPYLLLFSRARGLERTLASWSLLSLSYMLAWPRFKLWLLQDELEQVRTSAPASTYSAAASTTSLVLPWARAAPATATTTNPSPLTLSALIRQRQMVLLGLLGFRRFYTLFHNRVLAPMIVGKKSVHAAQRADATVATPEPSRTQTTGSASSNSTRPSTAEPFQPPWETDITDYADFEINFGEDILDGTTAANNGNATTVYNVNVVHVLKAVVGALLTPSISASCGLFVKNVCEWTTSVPFLQTNAVTRPVVRRLDQANQRMDSFLWSVVGGCAFVFIKDITWLFYNRFRRKQRSQMRIKNYPHISV